MYRWYRKTEDFPPQIQSLAIDLSVNFLKSVTTKLSIFVSFQIELSVILMTYQAKLK